MGGVMRPVGPESAETYWMRRALVVGAFLVLLIILLIVLFNLGGSPGQAAPAPAQTGIPVSAPPSATPSVPTPGAATGSPATSSASPTPSSSTSPSTSPSTSASASPSQSASPSVSPSQSASGSPSPTGKTSKSPSDKAGKSDSSKPKPSKPAAVTACTSDDLKAAITSKHHTAKVGAKVSFDVSYTNSSKQPCTVSVSPDTYQLTIYSGSDRIWSTADCAKLVHTAKVTLKPGHAVAWSITWNGKRSQQGATCQNRPETPQPGYYHATSQLKGTPAQDYLLVLN